MNGNRCEYLFSNNIYHFIIILHEKWFHSQCYRQWLYRAPLCITIKIWVVAYLEFIICFPSTFFLLSYFMQLFIADATMSLKRFSIFFLNTKSWKNHQQKLLRIPQIHFFFLTALTARPTQTEEFMFQNVAYWPTVYRTSLMWSSKKLHA